MSTRDISALFAEAERAYLKDDMAKAESLLSEVRLLLPSHPRPWHLSALVAERAGRPAEALDSFRRAASLAPQDGALWTDLADRLAESDIDAALQAYGHALTHVPRLTNAYLGRARIFHRLGRAEEARADLLRVYQLEPRRLDGWLARGALEIDAGAPASAAIAYDRALGIAPDNVSAGIGRARAALETGDTTDAVRRFGILARVAPNDTGVAAGEAEARELAGEAAPHRRLEQVVTNAPDWAEGHALLARMLWEDGAAEFDRPLRRALEAMPRNAALHRALIVALAGTDHVIQAADAAGDAARLTNDTGFRLDEAAYASQAGDLDRADAIFEGLSERLPRQALHRARHAIRRGDLERAETLVGRVIDTESPEDSVPAWALMDLLWRARGDARAAWLHGQDHMVRRHALALDPTTIGAVADYLRSLHHRARHPVGQSMRGGTQTRGRLLSRPEPLVRQLRETIGAAVLDHWRQLPPHDEHHPLLRHRDRAPSLSGSWSVRLTGGGRHVAHIHPHGVLSSASYWSIPSGGEGDAGWLEIGRPPADLPLDLQPIARFAPEVGTLVLFPSTAFHGTRPFPDGERITLAFDIAAG